MREITNRIADYYKRAAEHMAKFPDELEWRRENGKRIKARLPLLPIKRTATVFTMLEMRGNRRVR